MVTTALRMPAGGVGRRNRQGELWLAGAGVLVALLIAFDVPGPFRAVAALAVWLALPGWAVIRRFPIGDPIARVSLTVVTSGVLSTALSLLMVWTRWWFPVAAGCVLMLGSSLAIVLTAPNRALAERWAAAGPRRRGPFRLTPRVARAGLLVLAAAIWALALVRIDTTDLGEWGLLPRLPALLYIALALVLVVAIWELAQRPVDSRLMAAATAVLVLILNGTANIVESAPRLPWSYKHMAVTRLIDVLGGVDPDIDLYNRWPGFFSLSAFVGRMMGEPNPVTYAGWAELGFSLLDVLLVFAIARALRRSAGFAWTAALLFAVGNWVGQNYYAPQAFGFALFLAACLLLLTYATSEPGRLGRRVERLLTRPALRDVPEPAQERVRTKVPAAATIGVLILQSVMVVSHQLSPYLAVLAVLPLSVLGFFRPRWVGPAMLGLAVLYLVPNFDYVQGHFGLFSGFDPVANATYSPTAPVASTAAALQGRGVVVISGLVLLMALAGYLRSIWSGNVRATLVVGWLAVAPALSLLGQTYGGEGRFRVYLFGLPWYAIGAAWLFTGVSDRPVRRALSWLRGAVLVVLTALFVFTYYQPEADYQVPRSDVVAAEWLDGTVRAGDRVITAGGNFPAIIGPNYPLIVDDLTTLTDLAASSPEPLTPDDLQRVIAGQPGPTYIVFSDNQTRYADAHQLLTESQMASLEAGLADNPYVTLVYDVDGVRIYRYG